MDLAEIRKKARLQNAHEPATGDENRLPQPATLEIDNLTHGEILETFWQAGDTLAVTTEEEYVQGLNSLEQEGEERTVRWLTFLLGNEEYALELSAVLELIRPRHLTELPQVPDYLLGIVSLRGVIVPVIDLGRRLSLASVNDATQQRVIVCASGGHRIGLLVDRVTQVIRIDQEKVEAPPLLPNAPEKDFIAGVGRIENRMLILLSLDKVMNIEPLELFQ